MDELKFLGGTISKVVFDFSFFLYLSFKFLKLLPCLSRENVTPDGQIFFINVTKVFRKFDRES